MCEVSGSIRPSLRNGFDGFPRVRDETAKLISLIGSSAKRNIFARGLSGKMGQRVICPSMLSLVGHGRGARRWALKGRLRPDDLSSLTASACLLVSPCYFLSSNFIAHVC